jgi:hypothetical protein
MSKKRNASAPAASPASARAPAAKKSAARTKRTRSSKRNRSKLASPAAIDAVVKSAFGDATTITARAISAAPPPRIRIGDAMRRTGLDEYKVARTFAGVLDKLSDGNKDTGGVQKLLVDVLKECSRHLDPPQSERAAPAAPVHITMVHNVPRPFRTQTPPQQSQQQLNAAPLVDPAAPSATPASEPAASPAPPPSSAPADPDSQ